MKAVKSYFLFETGSSLGWYSGVPALDDEIMSQFGPGQW